MFFDLFSNNYSSPKSSSEWQLDFSRPPTRKQLPPGLNKHLDQNLHKLLEPPEAHGDLLKATLAKYHTLAENQVFPIQGHEEALGLVARLFYQKKVGIITPALPAYTAVSQRYKQEISYESHPLREATYMHNQLVYLSNPNRVHGQVFYQDELEPLLSKYAEVTFLLDETYMDFSPDAETFAPLVKRYQNLIIVRDLGERFQMPSLQLSYILADKKWIKKLSQQSSGPLNILVQEVASYLLDYELSKDLPLAQWMRDKQILAEELAAHEALSIDKSSTPYFIASLKEIKAGKLKNFLEEERSMNLQVLDQFPGLDETYFRIFSQSEDKNRSLASAIQDFLLLETSQK